MAKMLNESELRIAIISTILTIILTIIVLHMNGFLNHSTTEDAVKIDTFKLLSLKPGYQQGIASKKAQKTAFCSKGYLLIRSQIQQQATGILVDHRNRAIPCVVSEFLNDQ